MTRILIADDNQQNRYLLESLLKGNNFEVMVTNNGAEALDTALKSPPDLIITDILMPVMDGFELCRKWKADTELNRIPFLFYTATYTDVRDEKFARSLGADGFIVKPQKPETLVRIIRESLRKAQDDSSAVPAGPAGDETETLRQYNEVLFRKLEKKVNQLEAEIAVRRKAEEDLRVSEKFLDAIIEHIPDMIFVKNAEDLRFVRFNKACEELLGITREEMIGKCDDDFFPEAEADFFREKDRQALCTKQLTDIPEERIKTRNRGERILHTKKILIPDESGRPRYLLGIPEDITYRKLAEDSLKESEEKFRTVVENVPDLILVHREGKIIFINSPVLAVTGYRPEEVLGQPISRFIPPETRNDIESAIAKRIGGEPVALYETDIRIKSGALRTVMVRGSRIEFAGAPAILNVLTDISERKRADERIRLANRKLELMRDVTYQDIQNKVTALRGYIELGKKPASEMERTSFTEKEESVLRSIHDLIQSTKDYQQMGVDQSRWIPIEETIRVQFAHLSRKNELSLECNLQGLEILAEPLIDRVIFNLLQNAARHGRTRTRISFSSREIAQGFVLVCEDDGIGIPEAEKARIFDRVVGGTGRFGLFFVREFLDIAGMSIAETGVPGKGARFEITIPKGMYRFQGH